MKKILGFLGAIVEIAIIIFAVAMVSILFMKNQYGYTEFGDTTLIIIDDENTAELSNFSEGDLVLIKAQKYDEIKEGDEVYYYDALVTESSSQYVVRTAKVKTKSGDNRSSLYTFEGMEKVSIPKERILGTLGSVKPSLGGVIGFLTSTVGFLLFVILPVLVLFIYQVYHLVMILKYDKD